MTVLLAYTLVLLLGTILVLAARRAQMTTAGRPLVSAYTVILGLFALYMFMPALMLLVFQNGEYVWLPSYGGYGSIALTAFVTVAALACFLGAYWLRARAGPQTAEVAPFRAPGPATRTLAWAMIVLGVLLKLYALYAAGGIEESTIRLSAGARNAVGVDELSSSINMIRYLSGMADASIVWLVLHQLASRRFNIVPFVVFAIVIGLSFFGTGKRLFLLWPLVALVLGFHYYVRPLRVNLAPVAIAVVILAGFATLMSRVFLPAQAAEIEIDLYQVYWAQGSLLSFYFFSQEYASFEVFTLAIENSDAVVRLFGDAVNAFYITNIQPISYFVPRVFWPGKPEFLVDLAHAYRIYVSGGELTSGGGINGTLTATSWTFGGPIGVAVAMTAMGYLSATMDASRTVKGQLSPIGIVWYAFGLVTVFHLFRQGTLGWTVMIVIYQQLGLFAAFILLGLFDRMPARRSRPAAVRRV